VRFIDLLGRRLRGLEVRSDEFQNIDDMVFEGELRHAIARRRAGPRELDPFSNDPGLVMPNEICQALMPLVAGSIV
jgi:hypothetical protein